MKLCMMSCVMSDPPETIVKTAVECGMTGIDWVCRNDYADPKELRKISLDHGLAIAAHTILGSTFVKRAEDALDDFQRSLEFAVELGAPILMLPPFPSVGQVSMEDDRRAWTGFYAECLPLTRSAGITLTLEATGFKNSPITTAAETLEVLHAVPGLKCTLDHGNMETAEPSVGAYTALRDYVVHIHLKDWKIYDLPRPDALPKRSGQYFAEAVIGEGDLPLRAFWDTLDARGRDLYVNMETRDFSGSSSTAAVLKRVSDMLRNW